MSLPGYDAWLYSGFGGPNDKPACACCELTCPECFDAMQSEGLAGRCEVCGERCISEELVGLVEHYLTVCRGCWTCAGCDERFTVDLGGDLCATCCLPLAKRLQMSIDLVKSRAS